MKGQATNIVAVVVVVAVVAGVAWFKSQQSEAPAQERATSGGPALVAAASPLVTAQAAESKTPAAPAKLPRLVDLGAQKCKACKALAPILDALREEYQGRLDVKFIDVWKNRAAGRPYGIRVIPTQVLFDKDGKEVWRHEGFISKEDLKKLFADKVGVK